MKQEQKSLTLCWWSCLGDSGAVIASILASKGAHSLSMCHSDHVMCWLSDSQDQTSLTHHLHSFPEWGNECVTIVFTYKNGEYTHFERMRLCSPFFDNNVHPTISAAALTLTLIASQQSLNAQQLHVRMYTVFIGSQWIVSKYENLHRKASKPLNFWSPTGHFKSVINNVGVSRYSSFGRLPTPCRSVH